MTPARSCCVTNLTREGVTVFRGDAHGQFDDVTTEFGLLKPTFGYTGFGTGWFDYDNDGWLDLFIADGAVTVGGSDQTGSFPYAPTQPVVSQRGTRQTFRETSRLAGQHFKSAQVSRGVASATSKTMDAIDLVVNDNNGPVRLLPTRWAAAGTG